MLQWRYHTANTWGSDENGTGTGHGPQEEFYGCADVEIIGTGATPRPTTKVSISKPFWIVKTLRWSFTAYLANNYYN